MDKERLTIHFPPFTVLYPKWPCANAIEIIKAKHLENVENYLRDITGFDDRPEVRKEKQRLLAEIYEVEKRYSGNIVKELWKPWA